jgi:23S rRNA (cytosine1962-C5)-methyltransferase
MGAPGPRTTVAARVVLKPHRARPFFGRHPWVFAGAIERVVGQPADGDVVSVFSQEGEFIGWGLYNGQSQLRVRLYSWDYGVPLDESFWGERIRQAIRLRREILGCLRPEGACRVIFSEADGLSGFIADWYAGWLVVQPTALGIQRRLEQLLRLLMQQLEPRGVYLRTEKGMREAEGMVVSDGQLVGEEPRDPLLIEENGLSFEVDIRTGQKTGWYLDQRDNRAAAARYAAGRRVLDMFCYGGGFSCYLARAGAVEVTAVDASPTAVALAERNARRNGLPQIRVERADAFSWLQHAAERGEKFDMVVLDPPRFARKKRGLEGAVRGYVELNRLGLRLLEPDGILVTCSCSGHVTREMFVEILRMAAEREKVYLQLLEQRAAAPDHPVSVYCPENNYLKCIIARRVG